MKNLGNLGITHKELVERAYKWVLQSSNNGGGCGVAFKELYSLAGEIPDVIGFDSSISVVIECKVSRSDFLKDQKKSHREKGMGNFRYYCCPVGLIKTGELPKNWGLIYVSGKQMKAVVNPIKEYDWVDPSDHKKGLYRPMKFKADHEAERKIMYTVIRRLFKRGFVKHIYKNDVSAKQTVKELIELNEPEQKRIEFPQ